MEQEERGDNLSDSTLALIGQYNDILETISKSFFHYDKIISEAEAEGDRKKIWITFYFLLWLSLSFCKPGMSEGALINYHFKFGLKTFGWISPRK